MPTGRAVSHGRGGAGNMHADDKATITADLVTPTLKEDFFTTGRGGTGNMMHNDKDRPELARDYQDVEKPPKRSEENVQFTGRGGVANAVIPTVEEQKAKHAATDPHPERASSQDRPKEVPGVRTR